MKTTFSLTQSRMSDLLLFIHGVMNICLVVGVMVLIATWPASSTAAKIAVRAGGHPFTSLLPPSAASHWMRTAEGERTELDFGWLAATVTAMEPISWLSTDEPETNDPWSDLPTRANEDRWDSDTDSFEPAFNIDGTMMMGAFDTNGNMYGVTDDHLEAWESSAMSSMWDD